MKLFNDVVEKSDILKFVSEGEAHERACRLAGSLSFDDADDDYKESSRHIVIDDDGPARPLPRPRAEASWHLHGAMNVPGIKHAFSNLSGDILQRWKDFKMFQEALTAVNTLHHQTFYRDRLAEVIGEPLKKLFKYYEGGNLVLWRWSSLVQVCEALHRREGALRTRWNLQRFLKDGEESKSFLACDRAIRSPYFWCYLKMVILLHGLVNDLSSWAEGCECHNFERPCPLRGRRAPECAAGHFQEFLNKTMVTAQSLFIAVAAGLGENSPECRKLQAEWNIGVDCIITET